mgnify:CR=1 FL=1
MISLLDTNTCIYLLNQTNPNVRRHFESRSTSEIALCSMVKAELLFQRGLLKNLTYTFKHILIQETAYNSLLKSKRRELHARAAEILKAVVDQSPEVPVFRYHLGMTYLKLGDKAAASEHLTRATDGDFVYDIDQHGPFVGLTYRF